VPSGQEPVQVTAPDGFACPPTPSPWSPCAPDLQPLPTLLMSRRQMREAPTLPVAKSSSCGVNDAKQAYEDGTPAAAASFMAEQGAAMPVEHAAAAHPDVQLDTREGPLSRARQQQHVDSSKQNAVIEDDAMSPSQLDLPLPVRSVSC